MPITKTTRKTTWKLDYTFHWPRKKGKTEEVALTDRQARSFVDNDIATVEGFKKQKVDDAAQARTVTAATQEAAKGK